MIKRYAPYVQWLLGSALMLLPLVGWTEPGIPAFTVETDAQGNQDYT